MKKIALLVGYLNIGGAEKLVLDLAVNLKRNNREVIIITIKGLGALEEEILKNNIPIYNLNCKSKFSFIAIKQLINIIRENNVYIMHSHSFNAHVYSVIASRICNIKHIHTEHNIIDNKKKYQIILDRILLKYSDKIVACSEYVYDNLIKYYSTDKLMYINNGISLDNYIIDYDIRNKIRNEVRIKEDDIVLITVAVLREQKNHKAFIPVLKELISNNRNIKWLVVGDGPCRNEIEELIYTNNLEENVIMYGSTRNINSLLNSADIFILPSRYEGLPLSILESMAVEVPVIASNVGGIGQVVLDDITGYKVDCNKISDMKDGILYLINNKNILLNMKKQCRKLIKEDYSLTQCYKKYLALYDENKA